MLDGKVIECATTYPNQQIRFFHRRYAEGFIKPVHERIKLKPDIGAGRLKGVEYVPLEPLEGLRDRWERYMVVEEEMTFGASRWRIFRFIFRHGAIFTLVVFRYARNLFFCRGPRMPVRYEWNRHKFTLLFIARLLKKLI